MSVFQGAMHRVRRGASPRAMLPGPAPPAAGAFRTSRALFIAAAHLVSSGDTLTMDTPPPDKSTGERSTYCAAGPDKSTGGCYYFTPGRYLHRARSPMHFSRYSPGAPPRSGGTPPHPVTRGHGCYPSSRPIITGKHPIFSYIFSVLTRHISKCVQILGVSQIILRFAQFRVSVFVQFVQFAAFGPSSRLASFLLFCPCRAFCGLWRVFLASVVVNTTPGIILKFRPFPGAW